jgi:hypothetical protein
MEYQHEVLEENVAKFAEWIRERGGIAVWRSQDLSDPCFSLSSPFLSKEGKPTTKPHWKVGETPDLVVTDPALIHVITVKEVKRFRVALRRGDQGFKIKLTDASSQKVNAAVERAGEGASYHFDYDTQVVVITAPVDRGMSLEEWMAETEAARLYCRNP